MLRYEPAGFPGTHVAFTGVPEGNLALHVGDNPARVSARRRRLEERLGLAPHGLRFMNQTHSVRVHRFPGHDGGAAGQARGEPVPPEGRGQADPGSRGPDADALLSEDGSTPLAVMVADCLPVVLVARIPGGGVATAAVHAGRKGLLGGILQNTLAGLREIGGTGIGAWIGPAICGRCYEVPADMAREAEAVLPGISGTTSRGTTGLDLPGAAARLLAGAGVQVHATGSCTLEGDSHHSYRRDAGTGRFAGIVWTA
jgi:YfiH family protein